MSSFYFDQTLGEIFLVNCLRVPRHIALGLAGIISKIGKLGRKIFSECFPTSNTSFCRQRVLSDYFSIRIAKNLLRN
jgi:hypothetical protein